MSILKDCLSWQTTKLSYKCRTSYLSGNSLCLHIPFVLSLPVLSLPKGRSTLLMKREDQPPNPFVLSLPALSLPKGRSTLLMKREDRPPHPFVLSLSKHIREKSTETVLPTVRAEPVEAHSW